MADPANPQSWNLYSYGWNNPLLYFDPSGLTSSGPCPADFCATGTANPPPSGSISGSPTGCYEVYVDGVGQGSSCAGGGPGGGGGGSTPPAVLKTSIVQKAGQLAACASDFASKYSIAGGLHALGIGKSGVSGFIVGALGGNTFSGLTDLALSLGSGEGGGHSVFHNMGQSALNGPTLGAPAIGPLSGLADRSATDLALKAVVGGAFASVTGAARRCKLWRGFTAWRRHHLQLHNSRRGLSTPSWH